ncbi:39S ribosomal protein L21, mitochondrial [Wickerhamomyces ciferrii]|uniref:Large ribosomal subunit protein bL21m n=1 Tax=Wickerhamomyces ciferrii (strain ATCC 14091 / BCRC 22168 / CBS 111 / JCM 3599 / NBRC 0793 / NRRL Y-1031 F-60-10) TaxID=1206466 RepID=K0KZ85_WICCF|nr:39S ribosomal protein L21, mitochondrial [Wickerhamomyces ciferrii]CCH46438.1 39S ribosomal protein L21, mitochondrial [Wickerhamomyces ciferrii]
MNSLFRSALRSSIRQPLVGKSFTKPVSTRFFNNSSILFNQNASNTTTTTPIFNQEIKESSSSVSQDSLWPLKLSNELYAIVKVHSNPFLVTKGDIMTLPYHLKTAEVGDILNFTDVSCVGSRNFTLNDDPIDTNLISVKGVVIEKTKMPMRITEVTKRRNRRVRHAISKPHKTLVRVTEIELK